MDRNNGQAAKQISADDTGPAAGEVSRHQAGHVGHASGRIRCPAARASAASECDESESVAALGAEADARTPGPDENFGDAAARIARAGGDRR